MGIFVDSIDFALGIIAGTGGVVGFMSNRIDELLAQLKTESGLKVTEFARACGLPPTTIYGARNRETLDNISIDVFLKIAKGFGMTAEELYYGTPPERMYSDARQQRINEVYETVGETQRQHIYETAQLDALAYSKSAEPDSTQSA